MENIYQIAIYLGHKLQQHKESLNEIATFADSIRKSKNLMCASESFKEELDGIGYSPDFGFKLRLWNGSVYYEGFFKPYLKRISSGIENIDENNGIERAIDKFYEINNVQRVVDSRRKLKTSREVWGDFNCYQWAIVLDLELACALDKTSMEEAKRILLNL